MKGTQGKYGVPWTRRVSRETHNMAHNVLFVMRERATTQTRAESAVGEEKCVFPERSRVSMTLALEQDKYLDELIIQGLAKVKQDPKPRAGDKWDRIQVYLGPIDHATADALESLAAEIRTRLGPPQDPSTTGGGG